jgi:hypothetical protein
MSATPYPLAALLLILTGSQEPLSARASDRISISQKDLSPRARGAVSVAMLRRHHAESVDHDQMMALQRGAFADARSNARVQMVLARERLREIRFERASSSKEK